MQIPLLSYAMIGRQFRATISQSTLYIGEQYISCHNNCVDRITFQLHVAREIMLKSAFRPLKLKSRSCTETVVHNIIVVHAIQRLIFKDFIMW